MDEALRPPTYEELAAAHEALRGVAVATPLLESPELNELAGGRLLCKAESLQRTGSYKFRGAYHRLSRLDEEERRRGIVAFSTGNFGQAVAYAAKLLGVPATIIVPRDAPRTKIENCLGHGAEVLYYDRAAATQREEMAAEISARRGLAVVRPGDDPYVVAGYGTVGAELLDQHPGPLDALLCPCGGGGLSAGILTAIAGRGREIPLFTVEPEGFDDTARSLALGERVGIEPGASSVCDAILSPFPAALPFLVLKERAAGGLAVPDGETLRAMALAFRHLKLVLEPAGAIALAAALSGAFDCRGKTVAVVCSGAGVDAEVFRRALDLREAGGGGAGGRLPSPSATP